MELSAAERFIQEWGNGERAALDQLMALVYHDLHRMAAGVLRGESTTNRTRPTALVNELYVELQRQGRLEAQGEKHFFSIAAFLMRQILVAKARKRNTEMRGSGLSSVPLSAAFGLRSDWQHQPEVVLILNDALVRLEEFDPIKARIVDLRFFADLSIEATAQALDLSPATVKRHWAVARVWLYEQVKGKP